jgi:hypothetical protein
MAQAINKPAEAKTYDALFKNIKAAFNQKYVQPDGSLAVDT